MVIKQQAHIDKQLTQIDELIKHNGQLISKVGTTTNNNTGGGTDGGAGNGNCCRNQGNSNRNTNGNGNRNTNGNSTVSDAGDGTNNGPKNRLKCAICPLRSHATADCWELDKNKNKSPYTWVSLFEQDVLGSSINKDHWVCGIVNDINQHVTHYPVPYYF